MIHYFTLSVEITIFLTIIYFPILVPKTTICTIKYNKQEITISLTMHFTHYFVDFKIKIQTNLKGFQLNFLSVQWKVLNLIAGADKIVAQIVFTVHVCVTNHTWQKQNVYFLFGLNLYSQEYLKTMQNVPLVNTLPLKAVDTIRNYSK